MASTVRIKPTVKQFSDKMNLVVNFQDQTVCVLAVAFLSYFSLVCFAFLFLESLCIAQRLVELSFIGWTDRIGILVLSGFGFPLIYTAAIVGATYNDLIPFQNRV
jgi:hypothetical protein